MKRSYSKSCSIALIAAIYILAIIAGLILFIKLNGTLNSPILALFCADVLATIIVWIFGLLYENVSVYDPYWSVAPPIILFALAFEAELNLPKSLRSYAKKAQEEE